MNMTLEQLRKWRENEIRKELDFHGGVLFLGLLPDRWCEDPTFRCVNGHVSHHVIKSELAGDMCPKCMGPCLLTFPEDIND